MATLKTDIVITELADSSPHSYMVRGDVSIEQVEEAVRQKVGAEAELMIRQDVFRPDTWFVDVIRSVASQPTLQQQIDDLRARVLELERAVEDERSYQREQLEY